MPVDQSRQSEKLGSHGGAVDEALNSAAREETMRRIWEKDAALWKKEEAHQKIINNALGWLDVPQWSEQRLDEVEAFVEDVRANNFTHVMLLGMGGSSLCPEVLRRTFGARAGYPELLVLDSTDPDTIADFDGRADPSRTLYIVASKSGSTIEPLSFYKYFFERVRSVKGERAGENFVAITDPQTMLERMAAENKFRHTFVNPSDIGGRYSALSLFGVVPAALIGIDVRELLRRATKISETCGPNVAPRDNEAARLGCVMGALAREGRDKLTILTDDSISSLGLWVEQLVAESTGKEDKGVIPVGGESIGAPEVYGDDRLFVFVHAAEPNAPTASALEALEAAGHPVVRRRLDGPLDLGREFFVWELATAVAGAILGIDPFDQPNVQESKDNTGALLKEFTATGRLPAQERSATDGALALFDVDGKGDDASSLADGVNDFLGAVRPGDYVALLAYIQETPEHDELLGAVREKLRAQHRVATTAGYGPRYLHSTGQLHKGGPASGVFILLTDDDHTALAVPGEPYDFTVLKDAQALGDFSSLQDHHRRALRLHLGADAGRGLNSLLDLLK